MNPGRTLGFAYNAVKQAITGEFQDSIMIVEYDTLAKKPDETMKRIYNFIGEEFYQHDFDNVEASYDEFDDEVQLPGLHTTRKKVEFKQRPTILPPDIWQRVQGMEVWK